MKTVRFMIQDMGYVMYLAIRQDKIALTGDHGTPLSLNYIAKTGKQEPLRFGLEDCIDANTPDAVENVLRLYAPPAFKIVRIT